MNDATAALAGLAAAISDDPARDDGGDGVCPGQRQRPRTAPTKKRFDADARTAKRKAAKASRRRNRR